jgi:hypothetical protein
MTETIILRNQMTTHRQSPVRYPTPTARGWILVVLSGLLGVGATGAAGEEPPALVTDRPDRTESSEIVPPRFVQLEVGWTHTKFEDGEPGAEIDSFPETLVRIGLSRRVELRLGHGGYQWLDVDEEGWADASIGLKVALVPERGARPQMAILGEVAVPTGDDPFTANEFDPSFRLTFSNTLTERLSLGYNVGVVALTREELLDEDTLTSFIWTVSLGISATDRLGLFVELFGATGLSLDEGAVTSADGGLTYRVRDNFQLDLSFGAGISELAPDWFAGAGLSYRFPR